MQKTHAVSEDRTKYMTPNHIITTQPPLALIVQIANKETFLTIKEANLC